VSRVANGLVDESPPELVRPARLRSGHALIALRRFARAAPEAEPARCELCSAALDERHAHLFDPQSRQLSCACIACGLLFPAGSGAARAQRLHVEPRVVPLPDLQLSDQDWHMLDVPVRLVLLFPSAQHERLFASYPNPQGSVDARLPIAAWHALVRAHPQLNGLEPELDALVLDGRSEPGAGCRVSIDIAHALLGRLRAPASGAGRKHAGWQAFEQALLRLQRGEHG
jgi:hypothetical protein